MEAKKGPVLRLYDALDKLCLRMPGKMINCDNGVFFSFRNDHMDQIGVFFDVDTTTEEMVAQINAANRVKLESQPSQRAMVAFKQAISDDGTQLIPQYGETKTEVI
jgi:hypothetical protein